MVSTGTWASVNHSSIAAEGLIVATIRATGEPCCHQEATDYEEHTTFCHFAHSFRLITKLLMLA
jgi:hypothetical protein